MALFPGIVVLFGLLMMFALFIWSACHQHWVIGGVVLTASVISLVLAAQVLEGYHPVAYGLLLTFSLFLSGLMVLLGIIFSLMHLLERNTGNH